MKAEIKRHLLPLIVIFIIISLFWFLRHVAWHHFPLLFLGLAVGSFSLNLDHLIYWFYLRPNLDESRQAKNLWTSHDFKGLIKLLESTHKQHISLIFHHYFGQVVLLLISLFVFTSSDNSFTQGLLLAANLHLIVDQIEDYRHHPSHLQNWLFAREKKQLPLSYLKYYLAIFVFFNLIFLLLLARSPL